MGLEGLIQNDLSSSMDLFGPAFMDAGGRHHANATVPVLVVVPVEVAAAEAPGIFDGTEAFWESGAVFQRLELRFRIGVVIGNVRPAVALRDLQVGEKGSHGLGNHGRAPIGTSLINSGCVGMP